MTLTVITPDNFILNDYVSTQLSTINSDSLSEIGKALFYANTDPTVPITNKTDTKTMVLDSLLTYIGNLDAITDVS